MIGVVSGKVGCPLWVLCARNSNEHAVVAVEIWPLLILAVIFLSLKKARRKGGQRSLLAWIPVDSKIFYQPHPPSRKRPRVKLLRFFADLASLGHAVDRYLGQRKQNDSLCRRI
jgi:hypothetical protein